MTRIIAGIHGGRRVATPAGRATRPTADRVREALFNSLGEVSGMLLLDLYAGSGAIGLEAVSRGATHVRMVESDPRAARVIRSNIAALGAGDRAVLDARRVATALAGAPPGGERYDVVVADPPYDTPDADLARVLEALVEHCWLAPNATVVIERSARSPEPPWVPPVTASRSRRYGETTLWYGRES